jgi:hypothetical protein
VPLGFLIYLGVKLADTALDALVDQKQTGRRADLWARWRDSEAGDLGVDRRRTRMDRSSLSCGRIPCRRMSLRRPAVLIGTTERFANAVSDRPNRRKPPDSARCWRTGASICRLRPLPFSPRAQSLKRGLEFSREPV